MRYLLEVEVGRDNGGRYKQWRGGRIANGGRIKEEESPRPEGSLREKYSFHKDHR